MRKSTRVMWGVSYNHEETIVDVRTTLMSREEINKVHGFMRKVLDPRRNWGYEDNLET